MPSPELHDLEARPGKVRECDLTFQGSTQNTTPAPALLKVGVVVFQAPPVRTGPGPG